MDLAFGSCNRGLLLSRAGEEGARNGNTVIPGGVCFFLFRLVF